MINDIYEPFRIAQSLGSELDAPSGSAVYSAIAYDAEGQVNFSHIFSSRKAALSAMKDFAIDELSALEYDAPWLNMSYEARAKLSGKDFSDISQAQLSKWLKRNSDEDVINAFWNPSENPLLSDAWAIRKIILD
jgi:hypothetical protein